MELSINELQLFFDFLIKKLKEDGVDRIILEDDYYRIIPTDKWSDFNNEEEPFVGSLVDDIESLKKTLDDKCFFTYTEFDRLASVLRAISQEMSPPE